MLRRWTNEDILKCLPEWGHGWHGRTADHLASDLGECDREIVKEELMFLIRQGRAVRRHMGHVSGDSGPLYWRK